MTVRVSADIHFNEDDVWHRWNPDAEYGAYGVLKFGRDANDANVYFQTPGQLDKVIAELVALRAEMDAPVTDDAYRLTPKGIAAADAEPVTDGEPWTRAGVAAAIMPAPSGMQDPKPVARVIGDSERTCPEQHPASGAHCHRDGDHGVHRDPDGETWRTDGPNPPHHAILNPGEKACTGQGYKDRASGFVCTAQEGHDGPDHVAYKPGGGEYHRWPAAAEPAPELSVRERARRGAAKSGFEPVAVKA